MHSLSRSEKSLVKKGLSSGGKKGSKYVTLFNDLLKVEEINEASTEKIRSRGLKRSDQFHLARHTVLERIVSTLAQSTSEKYSKLKEIKVAFHLNAFSYAHQLLTTELINADQQRKGLYLLELFDLVAHLRNYCKLNIELPKEIVPRKLVERGLAMDQELKEILTSIRNAGYQSASERHQLSQYALGRIAEMEGDWLPDPKELIRVEVRANLLKLALEKALELQEGLVALLRGQDLEFAILLRDLELLLRLRLECGHLEGASQIAWEIAALEPHSVLEASLHYQSFVRNGIFLASVTYDSILTETIWLKLKSGLGYFEKGVSALLCYYMALIFYSNQNYTKAKKVLTILDTYKKTEITTIQWQLPILKLAIHIELQEIDLYESLTRGADKQAKDSGLAYPQLIVSMFKRYIRQEKLREADIEYYYQEIDACWGNPDEKMANLRFNAQTWLLAKQGQTSMAEIELQQNSHKSSPLSFRLA